MGNAYQLCKPLATSPFHASLWKPLLSGYVKDIFIQFLQPFKQCVRSCSASKGRHCGCLCTDLRVLLAPSRALVSPSQAINTHAGMRLPFSSALHRLRADRIKCLFPLSPASPISVTPGVPWMCSQTYFNKVFSVWVL